MFLCNEKTEARLEYHWAYMAMGRYGFDLVHRAFWDGYFKRRGKLSDPGADELWSRPYRETVKAVEVQVFEMILNDDIMKVAQEFTDALNAKKFGAFMITNVVEAMTCHVPVIPKQSHWTDQFRTMNWAANYWWSTMNNAPRDGSAIYGCWSNGAERLCWWDGESWYVKSDRGDIPCASPVKWRQAVKVK